MRTIWMYGLLILVLTSCGGSSAQDELRKKILEKEEELTKASESTTEEIGEDTSHLELVELLLSYYRAYPKEIDAPECLDKVHMVYSALGDYRLAAAYGDTLLMYYPDYVNRPMILESQASTYDFYLQPRDTSKVRYYYELLLKEFPDLPKEKQEEIKDRLDHLELTFEELILKNN